jgi:hypothetical protein
VGRGTLADTRRQVSPGGCRCRQAGPPKRHSGALLDTSITAAFAVSLATPYAIGDVLNIKH